MIKAKFRDHVRSKTDVAMINILSENMLNKHFANIIRRDTRMNCRSRVFEKSFRELVKCFVSIECHVCHRPQRIQNVRKIRLELLYGFSEARSWGCFVFEKPLQQLFKFWNLLDFTT